MFPRPSNVMTAQEYSNGERHCVVVAAIDPFLGRIGTQSHYVNFFYY